MIEREVVFNLKNGDFAFCSTKKHIGKFLGKENSNLGQYLGNSVNTEKLYDEEFYSDIPCNNVRDKFIYLQNGIVIDKPSKKVLKKDKNNQLLPFYLP